MAELALKISSKNAWELESMAGINTSHEIKHVILHNRE
jgi:hypothetical protein